MQPDLRSHLALLERHGKLVRVPRPVDPRTELAALIIEAEHDEKIVAITAAMPSGTGLDLFGKRFPDRVLSTVQIAHNAPAPAPPA